MHLACVWVVGCDFCFLLISPIIGKRYSQPAPFTTFQKISDMHFKSKYFHSLHWNFAIATDFRYSHYLVSSVKIPYDYGNNEVDFCIFLATNFFLSFHQKRHFLLELPSDTMDQVKGLVDNLLHATQIALAEVAVVSPLRINRAMVIKCLLPLS